MSKSIWCRFSGPFAVMVGVALLGGCNSEENIPLKKVEFVLEVPKDYKETRKAFGPQKGSSAGIGHDPSGIAK